MWRRPESPEMTRDAPPSLRTDHCAYQPYMHITTMAIRNTRLIWWLWGVLALAVMTCLLQLMELQGSTSTPRSSSRSPDVKVQMWIRDAWRRPKQNTSYLAPPHELGPREPRNLSDGMAWVVRRMKQRESRDMEIRDVIHKSQNVSCKSRDTDKIYVTHKLPATHKPPTHIATKPSNDSQSSDVIYNNPAVNLTYMSQENMNREQHTTVAMHGEENRMDSVNINYTHDKDNVEREIKTNSNSASKTRNSAERVHTPTVKPEEKLCPMPYMGTECKIVMLGIATPQSFTNHSGYLSVNEKSLKEWHDQSGLFLFKLNYKCELQELRVFRRDDTNALPSYVQKQALGTLILAMSGDWKMLSENSTITTLRDLGIHANHFYANAMHGFVLKVGYPGVADWRYISRTDGHFVWSTSVIMGRNFRLDLDNVTLPEVTHSYPEVTSGGRWWPTKCQARWKVSLVIPFRDREGHLSVWLNNVIRFLQRQSLDFRIFVIEQTSGEVFNRASLLNVGYVEAEKRHKSDCYIFHDVDLIPEDVCNVYACTDYPRHMAVAMNKFGYKMPYTDYFGGVISLLPLHMEEINGFSNSFFGWGGEDDDIWARLSAKSLDVLRFPPELGRYAMFHHGSDEGNPVSNRTLRMIRNHLRYQKVDGLNSLNYTLLKYEETSLYTRILVRLHGPPSPQELGTYYERRLELLHQKLEEMELQKLLDSNITIDEEYHETR